MRQHVEPFAISEVYLRGKRVEHSRRGDAVHIELAKCYERWRRDSLCCVRGRHLVSTTARISRDATIGHRPADA